MAGMSGEPSTQIDARIRVRANTASPGLVVEVGAASFYFGTIRFKLWRAQRYLALLDRHGVRP